jgi:hypothetical protein
MDSLRAWVQREEKLPGRKGVLDWSDGLAFPVHRRDVVDGLISYASRSGVAFYTVDTRGLRTDHRGCGRWPIGSAPGRRGRRKWPTRSRGTCRTMMCQLTRSLKIE